MSGKYALIIANTEYSDPKLAKLTAPGKDAEDFAHVLQDKDICAFDDVKVLINQQYPIIRETIDEFFDQKKPDDLLVLYFSGHGVRDEFGTLYLTAKNTNRARLRSTAIKSDFIHDAMDQSRSKRQVLILDCCNSGAFPQGTKAEVGGTMGMTEAFQGYGRFVLTASDATQFAWEGDKVIGGTDNSLFTHFLVEGLEGEADLDGDGQITVDELYDFAYEQVKLATPKQTPSKFSSKQQGEIILRQNVRIEDARLIPLPDELTEAMSNILPYVREGAVHQLEVLLSGRNPSLARSAHAALEKIAKNDDSRRISHIAANILEHIQEEKALTTEKTAREKAEKNAKEKEERKATEKAAIEKAEREAVEKSANEKAKREAAEKQARERAEREAAEDAAKFKSYQQPYQQPATHYIPAAQPPKPKSLIWMAYGVFGFIAVVLCIAVGVWIFSSINPPTAPVENLVLTELPVTEAPTLVATPFFSPTSISTTAFSPTLNYFTNFRVINDTPGELQFTVDYNYNGEYGDILFSAGCLYQGEKKDCVSQDSSNFFPHPGPNNGTLVFRLGLYGPNLATTDQIFVGMYVWGPSTNIAYQVFDYTKQWTIVLPTPTIVN